MNKFLSFRQRHVNLARGGGRGGIHQVEILVRTRVRRVLDNEPPTHLQSHFCMAGKMNFSHAREKNFRQSGNLSDSNFFFQMRVRF